MSRESLIATVAIIVFLLLVVSIRNSDDEGYDHGNYPDSCWSQSGVDEC